MSRLQVLVTTMYQKDFSKYHEMNLQTDAVIANQADSDVTEEREIDGRFVKLVTTSTRGTSKNRNIALENMSDNAEFIMFSDDDLVFYEGYEDIILGEFERHPKAEAIKFNLSVVSKRKLSMKQIECFKRVSRRQVTSYGVCGLVIRRDVILKNSLEFNERFGTGTSNYCGEDSIFLQQLFKKGVNVFVSPLCIADIDQTETSWFEGYNKTYFQVSGMIINECYPLLSPLLVLRSAIKACKRGKTELKFLEIVKCYYKGIFKNIKEK